MSLCVASYKSAIEVMFFGVRLPSVQGLGSISLTHFERHCLQYCPVLFPILSVARLYDATDSVSLFFVFIYYF